jgi:hypothetical protein
MPETKGHRNAGGTTKNATGTLPRKRVDAPAPKPGRKNLKAGAGRGAGHPKHAATRSQGLKTSETRKAGPKKTARGTTTRSASRRHDPASGTAIEGNFKLGRAHSAVS